MMEWDKRSQPPNQFPDAGEAGGSNGAAADAGVGGALYVKVMTDEQLEVLRTQIAVYASICERLVEMHKAITAQQDLAGVRLGHLYSDPLVTNVGHKISARQRWTPTPVQLQKLEHIFDQGTGTPSKQKIKEITAELSQHGQISETNVYNWFQNRRARSKRKQLNAASSNAESEFEADAESPKEEKTNPENLLSQHNSTGAEDHCYQVQDMSSEIHTIAPHTDKVEPMFLSDGNGTAKPSQSSSQLAFYESILENSNTQICPQTMATVGMDHFMGKMEAPGGYNPYHPGEDYSI